MTASGTGERPSRPSVGGVVHSVIVLVLMVVIAAMALVVAPPAPPGIAEFAPRATETIDEALKQQSSQFGSGEGGDCAAGQICGDGGAGTTTTTTTTLPPGVLPPPKKPQIVENRVKSCIGDPPRQTEDPQSPPCKNYWEGNNGGATSRGVTPTEILVGYFPDQTTSAIPAFVNHFNRRYQFYGRSIRMVPLSAPDPKAGAKAADEAGVFAALDFKKEQAARDVFGASAENYFRDLAKHKIIGIAAQTRRFTNAEMKELSPYYWTFELGVDELFRHTAALICDSLRGRPARHGGPQVQLSTRKFAVVYERVADRSAVPLDALDEGLSRCGEKASRYEISDTFVQAGVGRANDMSTNNVTSVIVAANVGTASNEFDRWAQASFEPEVIVTGYSMMDHEAQWHITSASRIRAHMFGVGPFNRLNPVADEPAVWAAREGDPNFDNSTTKGQSLYSWYHALLILASGVQMAGPNLTPTTFGEALTTTRFPNPGAGAAPYWQAHVGFGPNDFTMTNDVTAVWWSETAPSYRGAGNPRAGWCYVNHGARLRVPKWPQDIDGEFFRPGSCR